MADAELGENLGSGTQSVPVAAGTHDDADHHGGAVHDRSRVLMIKP
jgi:hypothetical protein